MRNTIRRFVTGALLGAMIIGTAACVPAAEIAAEEAKEYALESVGLTKDQVVFISAARELDDGTEVFDIEFIVPGEMKYEFDIDAVTGAIIDQDFELWEADDELEYAAYLQEAEALSGVEAVSPINDGITELQARMIALKDTGNSADEMFLKKCTKDIDDGIAIYEVELLGVDGVEYEYEIRASDGAILEKDIDLDRD